MALSRIITMALVSSWAGMALGQDLERAGAGDPMVSSAGPFRQGQADRQAWEAWVGMQSGERQAGAQFWAAHRSLAHPPNCEEEGGSDQDWIDGCEAAQQRLANSDRLRRASPEYRLGWNSVTSAASATAASQPSSGATVGSPPQAPDAGPVVAELGPSPALSMGAGTPVQPGQVAAPPSTRPTRTGGGVLFWLGVSVILAALLLLPVILLAALTGRRSNADDQLRTLLLPEERIVATAMQHRLRALLHRRSLAAATSGRFIFLRRRLFGGFEMFDFRWQDIKEAKIDVGLISATVRLAYSANLSDTAMNEANTRAIFASGLVIDAAQAVYRECQAQEQAWRERRRVRSIEEMRAKAGGVQIATGVYPAGSPPTLDPRSQVEPAALTDKLAQARELRAQGLITDSEYETIKARLVQSF